MKNFFSFSFSIAVIAPLALSFQLAQASDSGHAQTSGEEKSHTDWNEIFKQPVKSEEKSSLPSKTELLEPTFMAKVTGAEVTLKWKSVEGVKYHLQVATDPNFKWLVTDQPLTTANEFTIKDLQKGQQYFWRVYTQKSGNIAGHSKNVAASSMFETSE
jgi:hypothetical protein